MKEEIFQREIKIIDKTEIDREKELIIAILKAKEELKIANVNFEFAENDLIDYYTYQIKANQAKLNYLLRIAKSKGIVVDRINQIIYSNYNEDDEAV